MILKKIILSVTLFYLVVTFYFNLPSNYLKIHCSGKFGNYFNFFMFQRWNFFAPPPNFNDRLYYTFKMKSNNKVEVYEVLEPLSKKKCEKAPFNGKEGILDYLLTNSVIGINDELYKKNRFNSFLIATEKQSDSSHKIKKDSEILNTSNFQTLLAYGKLIIENNSSNQQFDSVQITIARIIIPKFLDRYKNKDSIMKGELFYKSGFISLK